MYRVDPPNTSFEKMLSPNQLAVWRYLQTVEQASPLEISQEAEVVRVTVSQVLNRLLKLKKVERLGQGRAVRYRILR